MTFTEEQLDNLAVAFEEMPRMLEAYDDGRAEGRREMLWLMAVGANIDAHVGLYAPFSVEAHERQQLGCQTSRLAMRLLLAMGDEGALRWKAQAADR